MHDEALELLSAFLDGEEVDPRALAEALSRPGARDALRDWTVLRAEVRDAARPSPAFYARMDAALARAADPWWRRAIPIPWPALAAAGAIVLAMVVFAERERPETPPVPTRTFTFEEGVEWHGRS
jgi:negative regulator of sigma E activity